MTPFDALALLGSALRSYMYPTITTDKVTLSEQMINFICLDLQLHTEKELCILLCLPKYLPTDRLHLVGALLTHKISGYGA